MDQEYKADVCCPRNTSAAEVDNSVEKLIGDSTVRNVGHDELSPVHFYVVIFAFTFTNFRHHCVIILVNTFFYSIHMLI
jgi:hypothetical protein